MDRLKRKIMGVLEAYGAAEKYGDKLNDIAEAVCSLLREDPTLAADFDYLVKLAVDANR